MYKYLEILKRHSSTEQSYGIVAVHSLEVLAKAIDIVARRKLFNEVDLELVIAGALLHDIGTFPFLEAKDMHGYIRHGVLGASILEKEGLDREALIAKRHTGAGLTKEEIISNGWDLPHEDLLPVTLEEKLICYADKFSSKKPGKVDTLPTIMKEFENYGPASLQRFLELKEMFE
jgi:uncharacterized protein